MGSLMVAKRTHMDITRDMTRIPKRAKRIPSPMVAKRTSIKDFGQHWIKKLDMGSGSAETTPIRLPGLKLPGLTKPLTLKIKVRPDPNPSEPTEGVAEPEKPVARMINDDSPIPAARMPSDPMTA